MIKTQYLALLAILGITGTLFGITYAPALMTITLDGNVIATNDMNVNGVISGQTISDLDSRITILEGGS